MKYTYKHLTKGDSIERIKITLLDRGGDENYRLLVNSQRLDRLKGGQVTRTELGQGIEGICSFLTSVVILYN